MCTRTARNRLHQILGWPGAVSVGRKSARTASSCRERETKSQPKGPIIVLVVFQNIQQREDALYTSMTCRGDEPGTSQVTKRVLMMMVKSKRGDSESAALALAQRLIAAYIHWLLAFQASILAQKVNGHRPKRKLYRTREEKSSLRASIDTRRRCNAYKSRRVAFEFKFLYYNYYCGHA